MYGWEGRPFASIARLAIKRDPRRYPIGCATSDGTEEVVQWFRGVPELVAFLARMEPQRWGWQGGELIALKAELQRVLTPVDVLGLSESARQAYNEQVAPHYEILWWGTFGTLVEAHDAWAKRFIEEACRARAGAGDTADCVIAHLQARARGRG